MYTYTSHKYSYKFTL